MNRFFDNFPDSSRIWLYQTNRELSKEEVDYVRQTLKGFVKEWAAHGAKLWADADVLNHYFVGFVVDESTTPPSGCSIDSAVRIMKQLGQTLNVDFFTRMKVTFDENGKLTQCDFHDLAEIAKQKVGKFLIFDPLVDRLSALRAAWPSKIEESSFAHVTR